MWTFLTYHNFLCIHSLSISISKLKSGTFRYAVKMLVFSCHYFPKCTCTIFFLLFLNLAKCAVYLQKYKNRYLIHLFTHLEILIIDYKEFYHYKLLTDLDFNCLLNYKTLDWAKFKALADDNLSAVQMKEFV